MRLTQSMPDASTKASTPTRYCLRCGYALFHAMTDQTCPECGSAFDFRQPRTTSPSPGRLRRFWRRRSRQLALAIVLLTLAAAMIVAVMEHRHRQVREVELSGDKWHGIYFDWVWTIDSDPAFYARCVRLEWWLRGKGDLGHFTANNIERVRRRLRSNFSPIKEASVYDFDNVYLTDDREFEIAKRALHLAKARGISSLGWTNWTSSEPDMSSLQSLAQRQDEVGKRAQEILDLADRLDIEIK